MCMDIAASLSWRDGRNIGNPQLNWPYKVQGSKKLSRIRGGNASQSKITPDADSLSLD
jgi:hypothetical protein